jgi:hypothetical protein
MPVDNAPDDEGVRQTYNFAPGYHGLVYRADGPDYVGSKKDQDHEQDIKAEEEGDATVAVPAEGHNDTKYKLQAMRWGEYVV